MKIKRGFCVLALLLFLGMAVNDSSAILPYSTFGHDDWQGNTYYSEDGLNLLIYFNVYDIDDGEFDWQGPVELPDDGYIYAYQISNHPFLSTEDLAFFSVLDIDGDPIAQDLMIATYAQDDGTGGIGPDPNVSDVQGAWEWSWENGYVTPGDHSWYLVFTSPYEPTKGTFEVQNSEDQDVPVPEIPEPMTVALLGLGSAPLLLRRKRRRSRA